MQLYKEIKNRDIVIVGQQPWDVAIGSNCKDIAIEMSKNNRVLYVNSPLDISTIIHTHKRPEVKKRLSLLHKKMVVTEVQNRLWNYYPDTVILSVNWINSHKIFRFFNRINNKLFSKSIKKAIKHLGFKNIILFNDNDIFRSFYLKDFLKPEVSIYYSRDYLLSVDYWKKHGISLERELISKSDVCVANSTYLADYCRQYNPHSYYVGQGCDISMYNFDEGVEEVPQDIILIKKPIIGYTGFLTSLRLDIKLLLNIAIAMPDYSFVFIGPEDEDFKESKLHSLQNVFFLGAKNPETLPACIAAFDVCINPQLISEVTIGNYPRKVDEYLAMGKPVVATKTPAMEIFNQHTYLAESYNDYCTLIQAALSEDNLTLQQQRKDFASQHTWEKSVNEIYAAIINTAP